MRELSKNLGILLENQSYIIIHEYYFFYMNSIKNIVHKEEVGTVEEAVAANGISMSESAE